MNPQLLAGLRHLRRHPGRVFQVVFAVALGVALFVSSYASINGIVASIKRSSRAMAGKAEWVVSGAGVGSVPGELVTRLRREPGLIAAPIVGASVTTLGDQPEKLQILGVDTQTDAMLRLFGNGQVPDFATMANMALVPNSVTLSAGFAAKHKLSAGATLRVVTRTGPQTLPVAGVLPDSPLIRAASSSLALMGLGSAETLFGQPGMVDAVEVAGVSEPRLRQLASGYTVRSVDSLSPEANDALIRVQPLYGLSIVAMMIGCMVVFSSVQVSVLERIKQVATFRAIGASRGQILAAILIEWSLVGLLGSFLGVLLGFAMSSFTLQRITGEINAMVPLVHGARAELSLPGFLIGLVIGVATVIGAALIPALSAVRESPLLALRPHTYRLKNRQSTAFWIGSAMLASGLAISGTGNFVQTLAAIAFSFFGLALLMPYATLVTAGLFRPLVVKAFGFEGFLAVDNLRKAPQRTAFNVISLGGALAIMVSTAALVQGFTLGTHRWIRASLPLDISLAAPDLSGGLYSEETLPYALLPKVARLPGVSFAYGVRRNFAPFEGHDIMLVGTPTLRYVEAHRRKGSLEWAHPFADPLSERAMMRGEGVFVSDNFVALTGYRPGDTITLPTPSGPKRVRILGQLEDYSWPRGLLIVDLDVLRGWWRSSGLTYVDVQVSRPDLIPAVKEELANLTKDQFTTHIVDRNDILALSDDIVRQSTSAASAQVWLAAVIGFLGIGNSLIIGLLQRQREIGLLRAIGIDRRQLQRVVAIEALLIGIGSGVFGIAGGLVGGWLPLRHFTFAITGYLFPIAVPWLDMAEVFVSATLIAILAAVLPARRVVQVPVLTAIAME